MSDTLYCSQINIQDFISGNVFVDVNGSGNLHQVTNLFQLSEGENPRYVLHIDIEKKED